MSVISGANMVAFRSLLVELWLIRHEREDTQSVKSHRAGRRSLTVEQILRKQNNSKRTKRYRERALFAWQGREFTPTTWQWLYEQYDGDRRIEEKAISTCEVARAEEEERQEEGFTEGKEAGGFRSSIRREVEQCASSQQVTVRKASCWFGKEGCSKDDSIRQL